VRQHQPNPQYKYFCTLLRVTSTFVTLLYSELQVLLYLRIQYLYYMPELGSPTVKYKYQYCTVLWSTSTIQFFRSTLFTIFKYAGCRKYSEVPQYKYCTLLGVQVLTVTLTWTTGACSWGTCTVLYSSFYKHIISASWPMILCWCGESIDYR
jgi:hypothetical protein